jgi:methyl-accepting chemotaxis protein
VRLQNPNLFGDDLSEFRPLVVAVNRDRIARKGVAVARTGPAVFGVVPVFDMNERHIGSFEVGIDFGSLLDSLKTDHGFELALLVAEEPLRRFVSPEISAQLLNEQNRVGPFIKTSATHWELLKQLVRPGDVVAVDAPRRYGGTAGGRPYGVVLVPIRNFAGEPAGVIAAAQDFSATRAAAGQAMVLQALIALFAAVILAGAILIVVRGMLLDPLQELRALREGRDAAAEPRPAEAG